MTTLSSPDIEEGRAEGRDEERINSIKNIMDSLKVSAKEAMNMLKISSSEQAKYLSML